MKNKIIMITALLAVMAAMTGIAAADPEKIIWLKDGSNVELGSPVIPNDGTPFNFEIL